MRLQYLTVEVHHIFRSPGSRRGWGNRLSFGRDVNTSENKHLISSERGTRITK